MTLRPWIGDADLPNCTQLSYWQKGHELGGSQERVPVPAEHVFVNSSEWQVPLSLFLQKSWSQKASDYLNERISSSSLSPAWIWIELVIESWWSDFWIFKKPGGSFKCLRMSYPPHQNRSGKVWGTCSLVREAWWSCPSRREVMTSGTFWGEGNSGRLCPPLRVGKAAPMGLPLRLWGVKWLTQRAQLVLGRVGTENQIGRIIIPSDTPLSAQAMQ